MSRQPDDPRLYADPRTDALLLRAMREEINAFLAECIGEVLGTNEGDELVWRLMDLLHRNEALRPPDLD